MTYTETQLSAIKLFGRKDLSDGCYTLEKNGTMWHCGNGEWKKCYNSKGEWGLSSDYGEHMGEILGHEPHLEDVFRVANERDWIIKIEYNYLKQEYVGITIDNSFGEDDIYALISYNPSIPLLDQPNLSDIISLFR